MKNNSVGVPRLRFPEFKNAPAWQEKKLGDISDVRDGTHDSPKFYDKGIMLITSKNLSLNGSLNFKNIRFISQQDYQQINKRSQVNVGDILFGMIGTIGNPVIVKSNNFAIKNVALIKQKKELMNKYFVYFLSSEYIAGKVNMLSVGNTQKFIALGKIRSIVIPTPVIKEQQKIADCLTSLDELIDAQSQKLASLKQHKKGLIQQLFPQKDANAPQLRFPAFKNAPAWQEKKLGDVGKFKSGIGFSEIEQGGKNGTLFFKVSDMNTEGNEQVMVTANNYVDNEQILRLNYKPINEQSIIFAKVGAAIFLERKRIASNFLIDNNMMAFIPTTNIIFIRQWLNTIKLSKYAKVGALPSYSASDLKIINISLPSTKEQQKIANCLTSLDELITAQSQKVASLKQHKKGLMQQLFPNNETSL